MRETVRTAFTGGTGGRPHDPFGGVFRLLGFGIVTCWVCLAFAGSMLYAGEAFAATGHAFLSSVSEAPEGVRLVEPGAVAVDRFTGQVFVGDVYTGYVDVFSPSGEYVTHLGGGVLDPVGIAVDEANGDVYVAEAFQELVLVYEPDGQGGYRLVSRWSGRGTPGTEFGTVTGVAVDNSTGPAAGEVYVVEGKVISGEGGAVDVFKPAPNPEHPGEVGEGEGREGQYLRRLAGVKLERPNGIAVSPSTGEVLVADSFRGAAYWFSAEGAYQAKMSGKGSPYGSFAKEATVGDVAGVAVDPASGEVYVAEAERGAVSQYSPEGSWEGWITRTPAGALAEPRGVALSGSGEVFVADAGLALVDRFAPAAVVPSVETGKVAKAGVTRTSAVLSGTIDGEGEAAEYSFQYGKTPVLGSMTQSKSSGTGLASGSEEVTGLDPQTTYYYRIVGEDEAGANDGLIREFETAPAVEALETGAANGVTSKSATLTGSLKRGGLSTHYYFQYGTSEAYGSRSPEPPGEVPPGQTEKEEKQARTLETALAGLAANTTYHYRLVAENEPYGATYGADRTFTTSGPPRIAYQPSTGITQHEATIHAQINPDQFGTTYRFQYGETTAYGQEAPEGGEAIGSGATPVERSATLTNLKVGTTYHFRVIAENEAGISEGLDQTFVTVASAPVDATYATDVTATQATLHAQINPLGNDTRYYFQYGTGGCAQNPGACANTPLPPGEDVGSGTGDVPGEVKLSGLSPGTTYHYRVLDSNALGDTEGPERAFTTQSESSFALPDGRAWEMVSPPDKGGAPVEALTREGAVILAAEHGDALTYVVDGALGEGVQGNRSPEWQQVLARRTPQGWVSRDIETAQRQAEGARPGAPPEYQMFSPDLSMAVVEPVGLPPLPPLVSGVTQITAYLRDNVSETYTPLVYSGNVSPGAEFSGGVHVLNATPDLSHVAIGSAVALTGGSSAAGLYEWSAGQLKLLSVWPNGKPVTRTVELGYGNMIAGSLSSDGSRIVWTTPEETPKLGHLYLRDAARGETIQLDAAQGTPEPGGPGTARFQSASNDGSRVFFTDRQRLTPDSTAEPNPNAQERQGESDLYVCEVAVVNGRDACALEDLTVDHNQGEHAAVQGAVLATSQDGTTVYLVAHGVLASNENGNGEHPVAGAENLYELHYDGSEWSRAFIATLSPEDSPEWEGDQVANTAYVTARISPDGRYLAFMSASSLTGYDNLDGSPAAKGARDEEVYLYDAHTATMRCVSCNPTGARPAGVLDTNEAGEGLGLVVDRRKVWFGHWLAGNIPGWTARSLTSALYQSRYLSDDGRLYFNSPDDLVPAASNHKEDVYEYEPSGIGTCQSATGGCVSLISSGTSPRESAFIEATPDGSSVFFLTDAQLSPQDTDTASDIYDARECTPSSPCLSPPPAPPGPCAETPSCRPAETPTELPGGPAGTATSSGPGNPVYHAPAGKQQVQARKAVKQLTRAQRLRLALEGCRKRYAHSKKRREACERAARKHYAKRHKRTGKARRRARAGAANPSRARSTR